MAEINIERKKSVWPWIIAAIVVALLVWALLAMMGRDDRDTAAIAPVTTDPAVTTPDVGATAVIVPGGAVDPGAAGAQGAAGMQDDPAQRDAALDRYAGVYASGNLELNLNSAGTYTMRESPAGEGNGRWTFNQSASALHLMPSDGTPDRYFRVENANTLVPLNETGDPAAQMAPLQRVTDR
ncbi:MAG: copper resistance protein NlpE [Pseudomonadota bacterium]|nr:copper resistance protein NlpE [Pseudomonadota bacterium]